MSQQKNHEPYTLAAGDSISFRKTLPDFPASDGWTLKYELRGQQVPIEFASTSDGDSHVLSVDAATTAAWIPGDYAFVGYAELGTERTEFFKASLTVTADLETQSGDVPVTTHAQRMLVKLEAVLEGKAGDDILDSEIEGTVIRRMPLADVYKMRAKYKRERQSEIAQENVANGRASGRKIVVSLNVTGPKVAPGITPISPGGVFRT